jgi:hypothetical protein
MEAGIFRSRAPPAAGVVVQEGSRGAIRRASAPDVGVGLRRARGRGPPRRTPRRRRPLEHRRRRRGHGRRGPRARRHSRLFPQVGRSPRPHTFWNRLCFYLRLPQRVLRCRGGLKSPWWRRRKKAPLTAQEWRDLFTPEGKLQDGGVKLLKQVRSGVSCVTHE